MSFLDWFRRDRFDKEAIVVSGNVVRHAVAQFLEISIENVTVRDRNYLILTPDRMKDFVHKYYHPKVEYHSNSEEFPDCDDFDLMARGSISYGAVREGMKYLPIFGGASYKRISGGWHRANFSLMQGLEEIFEPQNMKWKGASDEVAIARAASV